MRCESDLDPYQLTLLNLATDQAAALVTAPMGVVLRSPRFSPDGRHIAYVRESAGDTNIHVYDTVTRTDVARVATIDRDAMPDWTPDSQYVLFVRAPTDLYRVRRAGTIGPQLLAAGWGTWPDTCAPSYDRARTLIGPARSDWGNADPPFEGLRRAAIVAFTDRELARAVSFEYPESASPIVFDRSPGNGSSAVVAEVRATGIDKVLRDEGAGIPVTAWDLRKGRTGCPAALLVFSAADAQLTSVIPIWEGLIADGVSALDPAPAARVEARGGSLVISGPRMSAYDSEGRLVTGPDPVREVVLEARTGRLASAH